MTAVHQGLPALSTMSCTLRYPCSYIGDSVQLHLAFHTLGSGPVQAWMVSVQSQRQCVDQHDPDLALSGLIRVCFSVCFALKLLFFCIATLKPRDKLGKVFPVTSGSLVRAPRSRCLWVAHWHRRYKDCGGQEKIAWKEVDVSCYWRVLEQMIGLMD